MLLGLVAGIGCLLDCIDYGFIASAAAEVARDLFPDFVTCEGSRAFNNRKRAHYEARSAEAALDCPFINEGLLDV